MGATLPSIAILRPSGYGGNTPFNSNPTDPGLWILLYESGSNPNQGIPDLFPLWIVGTTILLGAGKSFLGDISHSYTLFTKSFRIFYKNT